MPTAAAVIIGNEILTGKFPDLNGPFLARRLRALGTDLRRIVVVPDDRAIIAEEVSMASSQFDVVFTSGGVGPTHDDVTLEAIALAFGLACVVQPELDGLLTRAGLSGPWARRMATVPEGSDLLWDGDARFPLVRTRNVYIFPGIPDLFQKKFEKVAARFAGELVRSRRVFTEEDEAAIAGVLAAAQDRWPSVEIGSYPRQVAGRWFVLVTLDARDDVALAACEAHLGQQLRLVPPIDEL